jgi:hypothetical protein
MAWCLTNRMERPRVLAMGQGVYLAVTGIWPRSMPHARPGSRLKPFLLMLVVTLGLNACRSRDQIVADQTRRLASLRSTIVTLGEAWLSGDVSLSYARTTLETVQLLLANQHAEWARSGDLLANPEAAALSADEEHLARTLALLWTAFGDADPAAVRQQLAVVESLPAARP